MSEPHRDERELELMRRVSTLIKERDALAKQGRGLSALNSRLTIERDEARGELERARALVARLFLDADELLSCTPSPAVSPLRTWSEGSAEQ